MVAWDGSCLTIKEQAELLHLNHTSLYRKIKEPTELEFKIKHMVDRIHTKHPFKGVRRIKDEINAMNPGFKGKSQAHPALYARIN